MKTIKGFNEEQQDALKFVLEEVSPNAEITVKDLRQIDKICAVIESSGGKDIELEDNDFAYLKGKFLGFNTWNPQARKLVLAVADALEKIES